MLELGRSLSLGALVWMTKPVFHAWSSSESNIAKSVDTNFETSNDDIIEEMQ
jgi:hypothetical protein